MLIFMRMPFKIYDSFLELSTEYSIIIILVKSYIYLKVLLLLLLLLLSHFSRVRLCVTPWTAAHQAPLSTEFSRQEYWSAMPFPSPTRSIQALKYWDIFRMNCPKQIFLILFCVELFF